MQLNEVGDNLLKGKHGCKLKYTNNLLFNKQWVYLQKTYCTAHGTLLTVKWQPGWEGVSGEYTHIYVWPSRFTVHLKVSPHCYSAISQYKIKSLEKGVLCVCVYNL